MKIKSTDWSKIYSLKSNIYNAENGELDENFLFELINELVEKIKVISNEHEFIKDELDEFIKRFSSITTEQESIKRDIMEKFNSEIERMDNKIKFIENNLLFD